MGKVDLSSFEQKIKQLEMAYKAVPTQVGAIAVEFFKERFREQAWLDQTKESWKPRKRVRRGRKNRGQALLVDTGRLKRSIHKIYADPTKIIIGTDVPYARIHNEGGTINKVVNVKSHNRKASVRSRKGKTFKVEAYSVNAHTRKMNTTIPKRQFMGSSYTLERRMYLFISAQFTKALKS